MISATAWVARGKAAQHPKRYNLDEAELERVSKLANIEFEDAKVQLERAQREMAAGRGIPADEDDDEEWEDDEAGQDKPHANSDADMDQDQDQDQDDLSRYNLDEYDDDAPAPTTMGAFSNVRGLQFYASNEEDPYITVQDDAAADEEEEREQLEVYPSDNLVLTAKTEDDVSMLEAYVYSSTDANLYVHHDLMLPSFPLCLEWLDYTPAPHPDAQAQAGAGAGAAGTLGNFVAVGTMDPEIEIWSMDVVEGMYPDAVLGQREATAQLGMPVGTGKKKRKQLRPRVRNAAYHVDAVLSLSWNPVARNLLASASADHTVKLWDLAGDCSTAFRSFDAHHDKVQSVAWQAGAPGSGSGSGSAPAAGNPALLLTGSYDRTVRVFDTRAPTEATVARVDADVEAVRWNGWHASEYYVSLETGLVHAFDARNPSAPTRTIAAHDSATTSLDISPHIPGALITGSADKTLKIWTLSPSTVNLVTSRDLGVGKVFSATFSPNDPFTIAAAGSSGKLQIWNALSNLGVRRTFADRLSAIDGVNIDGTEPARGDGVIGLDDDSEDDDDDQPAMRD